MNRLRYITHDWKTFLRKDEAAIYRLLKERNSKYNLQASLVKAGKVVGKMGYYERISLCINGKVLL